MLALAVNSNYVWAALRCHALLVCRILYPLDGVSRCMYQFTYFSNSTPNTLTRKTRSKKHFFYLGQSEWVDTSTWLFTVPEILVSSGYPLCLGTSMQTPKQSLPLTLFSLFTIINTSKQYHIPRGPTSSLICVLLDITTCRLKCCFQLIPSHG